MKVCCSNSYTSVRSIFIKAAGAIINALLGINENLFKKWYQRRDKACIKVANLTNIVRQISEVGNKLVKIGEKIALNE